MSLKVELIWNRMTGFCYFCMLKANQWKLKGSQFFSRPSLWSWCVGHLPVLSSAEDPRCEMGAAGFRPGLLVFLIVLKTKKLKLSVNEICWIIAWAIAYGALLIVKLLFWPCAVCLDPVQGLTRARSCSVAVGTWPLALCVEFGVVRCGCCSQRLWLLKGCINIRVKMLSARFTLCSLGEKKQ